MKFTTSLALFLCLIGSVAHAVVGSKQPIAIDADSLEVIQSERKAIFKGDVKAVQGAMELQSRQMTVFYSDNKAEQSTVSAMGALSRIEVDGDVRMKTKGESAIASRGIYDAAQDKVFLFGNVVLRRGNNVLNGSKLEYSLKTGGSVLSGGTGGNTPQSSGGRVRGVFVPNEK